VETSGAKGGEAEGREALEQGREEEEEVEMVVVVGGTTEKESADDEGGAAAGTSSDGLLFLTLNDCERRTGGMSAWPARG